MGDIPLLKMAGAQTGFRIAGSKELKHVWSVGPSFWIPWLPLGAAIPPELGPNKRKASGGSPINIANGTVSALEASMATSADILGSAPRTKVPARWARHYERLCAERDKLLERDHSTAEGFQPKLDDLADAASQEAQRSLSLVAATAAHGMMREVLEAIGRIERGTYGICEITGEPIATARLTSIPWARYSLKGQQQIEQGGFGRRTALPSLQGLGGTDVVETEAEEEPD